MSSCPWVDRFRTETAERDRVYADLTLRIRAGVDPERVFDAWRPVGTCSLGQRGATAGTRRRRRAAQRYTGGQPEALSLARNADVVNEAVRDQLVTAGVVDDTTAVYGADGLRIGVGEQLMTRLNDAERHVANRQTWTVRDGGELLVQEPGRRSGLVPLTADYVRDHVQLAYAARAPAARTHLQTDDNAGP